MFAAVTADPSAEQVHAMAESSPTTLCGLEAGEYYVVLADFQTADTSMRCPKLRGSHRRLARVEAHPRRSGRLPCPAAAPSGDARLDATSTSTCGVPEDEPAHAPLPEAVVSRWLVESFPQHSQPDAASRRGRCEQVVEHPAWSGSGGPRRALSAVAAQHLVGNRQLGVMVHQEAS